jgi:hypothetical protein
MEWYKNDPRYGINKRASIVIVDLALHISFFAEVETKNAFCVFTDYLEKPFISADDTWPQSWLWAFAPIRNKAIDYIF